MGDVDARHAGFGRQLFGTDGIRGRANVEPLTCETTVQLGRAAVHVCAAAHGRPARVVVGRDTRVSGEMLERALTAGMCSAGGAPLLVGTLPTPAIAFLTRALGADAGVVISASHNPFQDNGLKFFGSDGFKFPDAAEAAIERFVHDAAITAVPPGESVGVPATVDDAATRYIASLRACLPPGMTLAGLRIVLDCANGAAYRVGPQVLDTLGADLVCLGVDPDGRNINDGCGAVHPEALRAAVRHHAAHVGVALDGDADRLVLVDEPGAVVDGDELLAMVAADRVQRDTLPQRTVVGTVMSNMGLEVALRDRGVRLVRVPVGDRHVVAAMRAHGCLVGGEPSGHLIFLEHGTTGDGLAAALAVLRLLVEQQRPLGELKRVMARFPQVVLNVPVSARPDLASVEPLQREIARVTAALHDRGRVLVRYSGTEPLVRVMVEGERDPQVRELAEEIAAAVRAHVAQ